MKLYRSKDNLEKGAVDFINQSNEVVLFSAYIKCNELRKINKENKIKQIIVRWEINDICSKASDFECLYKYCEAENILLMRNIHLHAKVFWDGDNRIFFGSANVTGRGLGEGLELSKNQFNFELNGVANQLDFHDHIYLKNIIKSSEKITYELYMKIKKNVDSFNNKHKSIPKPKEIKMDLNKKDY